MGGLIVAMVSFAPKGAPLLRARACPRHAKCSRVMALEAAATEMALRPELAQAAAQTFEPPFNPEQLGVVVFVIAIPFGYWWLITVPEQRLALAKNKRTGEVREYIATLKEEESGRPLERWFFQKWLQQAKPPRRKADPFAAAQREEVGPEQVVVSAERGSHDQEGKMQKPEAQTADALPTLQELFTPANLRGNATPRFFSGDNPIVVTTVSPWMLASCCSGSLSACRGLASNDVRKALLSPTT